MSAARAGAAGRGRQVRLLRAAGPEAATICAGGCSATSASPTISSRTSASATGRRTTSANRYAGALERRFVRSRTPDDMLAELRRFYRMGLARQAGAHSPRGAAQLLSEELDLGDRCRSRRWARGSGRSETRSRWRSTAMVKTPSGGAALIVNRSVTPALKSAVDEPLEFAADHPTAERLPRRVVGPAQIAALTLRRDPGRPRRRCREPSKKFSSDPSSASSLPSRQSPERPAVPIDGSEQLVVGQSPELRR